MRLLILCGLGIALFTACKKDLADIKSAVPGSAVMVMSFNPDNIGDKADINSFIEQKDIKSALGMMAMMGIPDFVSDRSKTGLNFEGDWYFALVNHPEGPGVSALIPMKNKSTFSDFLKSLKLDKEIMDKDGYSLINADGLLIGFNSDMLVLWVSLPVDKGAEMVSDDLFNDIFGDHDQVQIANEHYEEMMSSGNDLKIWVNAQDMMAMVGTFVSTDNAINKLADQFQDGIGVGGVVFEKGYSESTFGYYTNSENMENLRSLFQTSTDLKATSYLPPEPGMILQMAVNPDLIKDWVGLFQSIFNIPASEVTEVNQFLEMWNGHAVMSVNAGTMDFDKMHPQIALVADMKETAGLDSLIYQFGLDSMYTRTGRFYSSMEDSDQFITLSDNQLILLSDTTALATLGSGTAPSRLAELAAKYSNFIFTSGQPLGGSFMGNLDMGIAYSESYYDPSVTDHLHFYSRTVMKEDDENMLKVLLMNLTEGLKGVLPL